LDVPEEVNSSVRFCFLSATWVSNSVSGGDGVESLLSREPSTSSPSWLSLASGALDSAGAGSALRGHSSGRGGREVKNWWPCKGFNKQNINNT
jgi:hypothetical protein